MLSPKTEGQFITVVHLVYLTNEAAFTPPLPTTVLSSPYTREPATQSCGIIFSFTIQY